MTEIQIIIQEMLLEQLRAGNPENASVFLNNPAAAKLNKGFDWHDTLKGSSYWFDTVAARRKDIIKELKSQLEPVSEHIINNEKYVL